MKYEEDVAIANDIATRVGKLGYGEVPDKPIVFIGIHRPKEGSINFRGEVLGHSFWEWDGDMIGRKMGLMKVLGYSYMAPSEQQIIKARDLSKNTPCFPSEGCVVDFRDFIVVKLSD